ncbi:MAG TPA: IucA/IucC family protein, partial [Pilimelia sp.]|nr:IucA/IucC family protein [Pilimelia sp.]
MRHPHPHPPPAPAPAETARGQAAAAVLARLWQALLREPVPGVTAVHAAGGRARVRWADGRDAHGPAAAPFTPAPTGLRIRFDGADHTDPAALVAALPLPPGPRARLAAEIADSVANLAMAYREAPAPPDLATLAALPPAAAAVLGEQLVLDGHPLHPCCRTRLPMTRAQVRAYAPEYRPVVPVRWWRVPADRWLSTGTGLPPLLPLHPFQEGHLDPAAHGLRPGTRVSAARPLMSLRTVALDATTHLKLAVDVQMTSAVRRVSPAAVHNGPLLSDLVTALARRLPGFGVLAETAAGAVCADG